MADPADFGASPLLQLGSSRATCSAKSPQANVPPSVISDDLAAALLDAQRKTAEGLGGEASAAYEECARLRWLLWAHERNNLDVRSMEALAPERSATPECSSWELPRCFVAFAAQLLKERDQAVLDAEPMHLLPNASFATGHTATPGVGKYGCVCEVRKDLQEAALAARSDCRGADDEPEVEPERSSRLAAECAQLRLELHSERLEASEAVAEAHTRAPHVGRLEEEVVGLRELCEQMAKDLSRLHQAHAESLADAVDARCKRSAVLEQLRQAEAALEILGRENSRLRAGMARAGVPLESRFGEAGDLRSRLPRSTAPNVIPKSPSDSPVGRFRSLPSSARRPPRSQHDVAVAVYTAAARAGMTPDHRRRVSP